ncbi:MAG: response regulator transcription factor [Bacteroidota bacterium]
MPTVLLVDDEPDLVELMRYNLETEGFEVVTAGDGAEALSTAAASQPDVVVLDVMMPVMDGLEACRKLRAAPQTSAVPILMLTARGDETDEIKGLDGGADDYIAKPVSPRVLVSRINALLRRAGQPAEQEDPEVLRTHGLTIDRARFVVFRGEQEGKGERIRLPRKEFELLYFLASRAGRVVSRQEVLDSIWGKDVYVTPRTVDVHIRKIRDKIGDALIETVTGVGYRFKE